MRKLGKILCLPSIALLGGMGVAQAYTPVTAASAEDGHFLFGLSAGIGNRSGSLRLLDPVQGNVFTSTRLSGNRFLWGVFGGYQVRCREGMVLGGELNVDWWDKTKTKSFYLTPVEPNSSVVSAALKRTTNVGLTARLGYDVASFFSPYFRAGIETSKDKLWMNTVSEGSIASSFYGSRRSWRPVLGVGVEMPVPSYPCLSFRAEYDHHFRGRAIHGLDRLADGTVGTACTNLKTRANSGRVSIVWNFL